MTREQPLPLEGLLVLDLCLFLAGPYAALRLQDLGARVIKVERPDGGDTCRALYRKPGEDDSKLFHTINRGKQSLTLDLKDPADKATLLRLVEQADVLIQNYRPGVAERLGLGFETLSEINPRLVYASISGYGAEGPWSHLPGQDLLAQARSGMMWLTGDEASCPTPTGLALADIYAGSTTVQGILAALVGRGVSGQGSKVETSLLEGLIDLQFEQVTEYLNNGHQTRRRARSGNANAYAPAPYGVYACTDGFLVIAMSPMDRLGALLALPVLEDLDAYTQRDEIGERIAAVVGQQGTDHWLSLLEPEGIWCAKVMDWEELMASEQFQSLDLLQSLSDEGRGEMTTTRAPLRLDGQRPLCRSLGPRLGADNAAIRSEFGLGDGSHG